MIVPLFWENVVCVRSLANVGPLSYIKIMELVGMQYEDFGSPTVLCWESGGPEQQVTHLYVEMARATALCISSTFRMMAAFPAVRTLQLQWT